MESCSTLWTEIKPLSNQFLSSAFTSNHKYALLRIEIRLKKKDFIVLNFNIITIADDIIELFRK